MHGPSCLAYRPIQFAKITFILVLYEPGQPVCQDLGASVKHNKKHIFDYMTSKPSWLAKILVSPYYSCTCALTRNFHVTLILRHHLLSRSNLFCYLKRKKQNKTKKETEDTTIQCDEHYTIRILYIWLWGVGSLRSYRIALSRTTCTN